jgi:hypothetical protein
MTDNHLNLPNDLSLTSLNLNDNQTQSQKPIAQNTVSQTNQKSYSRSRNRSSYHIKPDHSYSYTKKQQKQITIDYTGINSENFELEKELNVDKDRFFVIKSFSAQDVYNSIGYKIWCSTETGNLKLNSAFKESTESNGSVYLFFSVNGSGYFCGVAKMTSEVDFTWQPDPNLWSHSTKWKGRFGIKWIYVKNVPNRQLSYIKLENNENKPVTHSRDCQQVPSVNGVHVMKIIHYYHHYSSILDYSEDYE